jgi:26S proteasome regulatory subunit N1
MGKGLVTIQPYYYDRFLLNKVSMAGIIILANSLLDMEKIILDKYHFVLFYLALSVYPKMLFLVRHPREGCLILMCSLMRA